jgi:hypothetical protein
VGSFTSIHRRNGSLARISITTQPLGLQAQNKARGSLPAATYPVARSSFHVFACAFLARETSEKVSAQFLIVKVCPVDPTVEISPSIILHSYTGATALPSED